MKYSLAIAGSTSHTVQCAEALLKDERFELRWVLTPSPKPIGRKQVITPNPLHRLAEQHTLPIVFVEKKIDQEIQEKIQLLNQQHPVDFLLVVDFGYLIPSWLLQLPRVAPLNVHPSTLPRWRGSSPGQFVLLYGENPSSVSLIVMDEGLDSGPVVHQEPLPVSPTWTQTEYYLHSFACIAPKLAEKIAELAEAKIVPSPQPANSPTPIARRLTKEDGFVHWADLQLALDPRNKEPELKQDTSPLLREALLTLENWPQVFAQAVRALSPWPGVWTMVQTEKGEKRLKILEVQQSKTSGSLELKTVQLEGQVAASWNSLKNLVLA